MIQLLKKIFYTLLIIGGLIVVFVFGLSWYVHSSTSDQIFHKVEEVPNAYTVIILGASVRSNGKPASMLEDRITSALNLYREGKVKRFLLSGDNGTKYYNEPKAMKEFLIAEGVTEDHIFLDYAGFDTYDSMYRAGSVFDAQSAIVVTQEFHLPRAIYIANYLGLDYYGFVGDKRVYRDEDRNKKRELLANVKAFLELITNKEPTYVGASIPIDGPPQSTYPSN